MIIGFNQLDLLIEHMLFQLIVHTPALFQHQDRQNNDGIDDDQLGIGDTRGHKKGVHEGERDGDEEVGHILDPNLLSAIAQSREDGQQAKAQANGQLHITQQAGNKVDQDIEREERKDVVFFAPVCRVIDKPDDDGGNHHINGETGQQLG